MVRARRMRCLVFATLSFCLLCLLGRTALEFEAVRYFGCVLGIGPPEGLGRGPDDLDPERWCNVYSLNRSPKRSIANCLPLPTDPYPLICIHDPAADIFISASIEMGRAWEPEIVNVVRELLLQDPTMGLLDIGANIGQFSLLAARMGHPVVAVEAYLRHVEMIHKSVVLNELEENFTLVYNAVSDDHSTVALSFKKENMGAIRVIETGVDSFPKMVGRQCVATGSHVHTITMDDLLEVIGFQRALIKLDIEGHEPRVLTQAALLLQRLHVPYIITEWAVLREQQQEYEVDLVKTMMSSLSSQGYVPFTINALDRLNTTLWRRWPNDVLWKLKK